jgi:hypothetical protein
MIAFAAGVCKDMSSEEQNPSTQDPVAADIQSRQNKENNGACSTFNAIRM